MRKIASNASGKMSALSSPLLAADVGGTHARLGLAAITDHHAITWLAHAVYNCVDYPNLASIIQVFLREHATTPVDRACLACAGVMIDGWIVNENLPWRVSVEHLRQITGVTELAVINDFEALAYATGTIERHAMLAVLPGTGERERGGVEVMLGPGTGLGAALIQPSANGPSILPIEAGQTALAPRTPTELALLGEMAGNGQRVIYENVLSGPGILNAYRALCRLAGQTPVFTTPAAVSAAALHATEASVARQTLDIFCALLGALAGDLALLCNATGGVWLAGGILPQISDFLMTSQFGPRFLDKGSMRPLMARIPVHLMEHGQLGVIGAAGWYLDHSSTAHVPSQKGPPSKALSSGPAIPDQTV